MFFVRTYKFPIPPSRPQIFLTACTSDNDIPPVTSCCTVFIVSNGANIVFEHAAANPEASVFLSPSARADDLVVEVGVCWLPPRRTLRLRRAYDLGGIEMAFAFV